MLTKIKERDVFMKNFLKKSLAVLLSVIMVLLAFVMSVSAAETSAIDQSKLERYHVTSEKVYSLIGGITEREIVLNNDSLSYQQYIFVIEVTPDNNDTTFVVGYNDGDADEWGTATSREQAHALEETRDINVVASFNGDFFNTRTGEPTGLVIMQGETVKATNGYPFFGVTTDGTPVIRNGNGRTDDIQEAIAGYCMLVENGKCVAGKTGKLAPRTAVGIRDDGTVVVCVNDGRQDPYSYGFDNNEMANVMYALGCNTALNLDGGASSTFLTQREGANDITLRNKPSSGFERPLGASLHIYTTAQPTGEFDHITFNEPVFSSNVEKTINIDVFAVDKNGYKTSFPDGGYLEIADDSYGTISGTKFTANNKTGTTTVSYVLDGKVLASAEIEVYKQTSITELFNSIMDFFNKIRHMFERIIEEIGERFFGI